MSEDNPYGGKEINIGDSAGNVEITQTTSTGSMGDVQAGIEFIYHMREHLLDIGVATVYAIAVYALVLWIKKKLS
jgi:hypothetical protein|tara:strand:+ start:297 stop:521 length:225 start_codon:yes stop_codon:yes gene_type:complete